MTTDAPLFFWKETEPESGFLSPWYKVSFNGDNRIFKSAGHMILAEKAKLFGDLEAFNRIVAAETVEEQIRLSDEVRGFDEKLWQENALKICKSANWAKFFSSYEPSVIKNQVLAIGKRELVYASPSDRILGIGFAAEEAAQTDRKQWGQNYFGQGLDSARRKVVQLADPDFPSIFDRGGKLEVHW
ncbi:hypothetical protein N0V90_002867 [Kalmusia sp. IMI 367209]|nr:hypothetical protein N0V90_002867 [Kalmusia sp. IMI 367209]